MRIAAAFAILPVATALVALPRPALLLWVGLGVLVGVLTELWCRAAEDMPAATGRAMAVRIGAATVVGGWALSGTTLLIGPATVPLIPAVLAVVAVRRFLADHASSAQGPRALRGGDGVCEDRPARLISPP